MRAEKRMHEPSPIAPMPANARAPLPSPDRDEDEIDLAELLGVLIEGRWLIAAVAALALLVGGTYAFTATPIFRADALVQVEEKGQGGDPLKELSSMFTGETPAEAEIEILRSRSVVATVVEQLDLDVVVHPKRMPLFGSFLARRYAGEGPAAPLPFMSSYAFGGESLKLEHLEVPPAWESENLTLIAGPDATFALYHQEEELLRGKAGEVTAANGFTVELTELVARPGTHFTVRKVPFVDAISAFQMQLGVREKGKKTGVIQLDLQGADKAQISAALDALMAAYVQQNVDRKTEEAEKTLQFVSSQLPLLKANLEEAEQRLKEFQAQSGKVNLGIEAQALVDRAAEIEKQVTTLELQRAELRQRYTNEHPSVVALRRKLSGLANERRLLEAQARNLPDTELTSVRLSRDVKVANELYVLLLTKAQEIGVVKSGTIGNVRVIDAAVTGPRPVRPKKAITLALSLMVGLALGVGLTFLRRSLNRGVDDPDQLEKALGMSVFASVPHSAKQEEMVKKSARKLDVLKPLALEDPADLAVESLRSLRTSLQFSLASAKTRVVAIGGSRPGVGKSFISLNLAHVLADAGKKVLLIDGDLRKGQLHRYFGQQREGGLSELIARVDQGESLEALARPTQKEGLHFLSSGTIPPNPSELLGSDAFVQLLAQAETVYDLIIIDAPPILAVTDAAIIGRLAGVNLLVVKSGLHPLREIGLAVSRMEQSGARPNGFVFNAVPARGRLYGYGKYRYHYQYDYR